MSNGLAESTNYLYQIATRGLVPSRYNSIAFSPSSNNPTTITYTQDGETVATLTLAYSGSDITSITRS